MLWKGWFVGGPCQTRSDTAVHFNTVLNRRWYVLRRVADHCAAKLLSLRSILEL